MSVSRLTGVQLFVFLIIYLFILFIFFIFLFLFYFIFLLQYSSGIMVLFDNQGPSKYLNTLFLLNPLCFIIGFICDLFVARNDLLMS